MEVNKLISLWLLWLSIVIGLVEGKFKSLSCSSFDQQLGNFSRCDIKALSRTRNTIDITYDVFGSFNSANVQIAFFKRANGWRPFLYDFTISVCKFLRRPYHIIAIIAFEYLKPFTNLNHTCPYKVTCRSIHL
nr:uncharacterized protein LOC6636503 isoform X2 [Drosophila virilis]